LKNKIKAISDFRFKIADFRSQIITIIIPISLPVKGAGSEFISETEVLVREHVRSDLGLLISDFRSQIITIIIPILLPVKGAVRLLPD